MSVEQTAAKTAEILYILGCSQGDPLSLAEIAKRSGTSYEYCKRILTGLGSERWVVITDHGYLVPFTHNISQAGDHELKWISEMLVAAYEQEPAMPRIYWNRKWLDTETVVITARKNKSSRMSEL